MRCSLPHRYKSLHYRLLVSENAKDADRVRQAAVACVRDAPNIFCPQGRHLQARRCSESSVRDGQMHGLLTRHRHTENHIVGLGVSGIIRGPRGARGRECARSKRDGCNTNEQSHDRVYYTIRTVAAQPLGRHGSKSTRKIPPVLQTCPDHCAAMLRGRQLVRRRY